MSLTWTSLVLIAVLSAACRGQVGAQGDKHEDLSTGSVDTQGSRRAKGVQGVTSPHKAHVPSPEHMAPPTSGPV